NESEIREVLAADDQMLVVDDDELCVAVALAPNLRRLYAGGEDAIAIVAVDRAEAQAKIDLVRELAEELEEAIELGEVVAGVVRLDVLILQPNTLLCLRDQRVHDL